MGLLKPQAYFHLAVKIHLKSGVQYFVYKFYYSEVLGVLTKVESGMQGLFDTLISLNSTWCALHSSDCHKGGQTAERKLFIENYQLVDRSVTLVIQTVKRLSFTLRSLDKGGTERSERDWSRFIKWIFGNPSSYDFEDMVKHLDQVKEGHNALRNDTIRLKNGIQSIDKKVNRHEKQVIQLMRVSNELWDKVDGLGKTLSVIHEEQTRSLVIQKLEYLDLVVRENLEILLDQERFLQEMIEVENTHRVHPGIVGVELMRHVLDEIAATLPHNLQVNFLPDDSVWDIYRNSQASIHMYKEALHLFVEVPLADKAKSVELYGVTSLPEVMVGPKNLNWLVEFELEGVGLAIAGENYAILNEGDWQVCTKQAGRFCDRLKLFRSIRKDQQDAPCLLSVYLGRQELIENNCLLITKRVSNPYVLELSHGEYLIASVEELKLVKDCPEAPGHLTITPPSQVVKVEPLCRLVGTEFQLTGPSGEVGYTYHTVHRKYRMALVPPGAIKSLWSTLPHLGRAIVPFQNLTRTPDLQMPNLTAWSIDTPFTYDKWGGSSESWGEWFLKLGIGLLLGVIALALLLVGMKYLIRTLRGCSIKGSSPSDPEASGVAEMQVHFNNETQSVDLRAVRTSKLIEMYNAQEAAV